MPQDVEILQAMFEGMLIRNIPLSSICIGLHNACAHGTHIPEQVSGEDLRDLYAGLDAAVKASLKIVEGD